MPQTYDAIVIGAGVIGASSALHLAHTGLGKILVLEKAPGVGFGSTGKSSACIRQTYSHQEVVLMAREATERFHNWQEFVGLKETRADFRNIGVLFLFPPGDTSPEGIIANHKATGVKSSRLTVADALKEFPDLHDCGAPLDLAGEDHDCLAGFEAIHEPDGGFADPVGTAEDMLEAARNKGVEVRFRSQVENILQSGGKVTGVQANINGNREEIHAPIVVNCAGPWAMGLNELAGVPLRENLVATRIQVVGKRFTETLKGGLPMVADMITGVYFRPDPTGSQIILGSVLDEDEREAVTDPDNYNEVADAPFREEKLTLLHHRIPTFHTRGDVSSYCGLYTVNREDTHPIIDGSDLQGYFYVNGFSGHGFKLSPVVGNIVAQKVTGQQGLGSTGVPINFFDRNRKPHTTLWGGVIA